MATASTHKSHIPTPSLDSPAFVSTRRHQILRPLLFPESQSTDLSCFYEEKKDLPIPCLLCEMEFIDSDPSIISESSTSKTKKEKDSARQRFLYHMLTKHNIVIHGTENITSFKCYAKYWKERLLSLPHERLSDIFPVIQTNPETRNDLPERYFLFNDSVPEDKDLREFLRMKRLEALLELQHFERTDNNFKRLCLFCHETFTGNRSVLLEHLFESHSFRIGKPDNIVMIDKFLDSLQEKLENLQCLYCERMFRDYGTLRDHMRKKYHKKINPKNKAYDKFYMINYLEEGKSWEDISKETDQLQEDNEEETEEEDSENWSDWAELMSSSITCLFCSHTSSSLDDINRHMTDRHDFNLEEVTRERDYYSRVKIINYIRRQVYNGICIHCCSRYEDVIDHMNDCNHFRLPDDRNVWDQSQYFFPTYENDQLLCVIEDETTVS
ncbi:PREDICTED: zinc finger protein 277-like [Amphimedon queenslandica]|uniref:C2H2-type domain-containing protein n=1 Tax=Amphimedon queenslandica TaxID=400682 RepID=A0A1X7TXF9_AMPQE|nr:PREDICTED: zinc finger protein 277-like [Amphimedon queenslandica]|eukprot:XP_011406583.1 PREDICTED: zinc finger protein 277-like [Amphimedon queenslandica]